jgi:hypothetical protein
MIRPLVPALAVLALQAGCFHVRPESLVPAGALSPSQRSSEYLLGRESSFLVLGDSSSFVWPELLQDVLDTHARIGGRYHVLNASFEGARAVLWNTADAQSIGARIDELLASETRQGAPPPEVALCQVSLRGVGDERGPVKSEHDMLGAERGADVLERMALELRARGVKHVLFATPAYVAGAEPELGLERVALARLLARGHDFIEEGPDLHAETARYYPDAYEDRGPLNEFGVKLLAEHWYRRLAGPEAREEVVEALYARDFDVRAIESAHLEQGAPRP